MTDEAHFCWEQCCDRGPHACICGNDCEEMSEPWESKDRGVGATKERNRFRRLGEGRRVRYLSHYAATMNTRLNNRKVVQYGLLWDIHRALLAVPVSTSKEQNDE